MSSRYKFSLRHCFEYYLYNPRHYWIKTEVLTSILNYSEFEITPKNNKDF